MHQCHIIAEEIGCGMKPKSFYLKLLNWRKSNLERTVMSVVEFQMDGELGILTVNNPPINLADDALFVSLHEAIDRLESSGARAALIRAEGEHFGCGVNVNTTFVGRTSQDARPMLERGVADLQRLERMPIPIICAVQGLCLAAGLEIALRCDIIIASETAQFAQVEQHIGAATYLGGAYLLAERCGPARARHICFSGDFFGSDAFERWGIINQVVADGELETVALAYAKKVAKGPTKAHAITKQTIRKFLDDGVEAADRLLLDVGPALFDSHDFVHGVDVMVKHGSKAFRGLAEFTGK